MNISKGFKNTHIYSVQTKKSLHFCCTIPLNTSGTCYIAPDSVHIKIQSHQNPTLVMGKVGCHANLVALLVGFLGGSVLKVGLAGVVKK